MHPWAIKICHWKWELNQCLHRDWSLNKFVIRSYLYSICVFSLFLFQPFGTKNKTLLFTMWRYLLLKHSWSETVVILVKVWAEVKLNLRHFIFFIQNVCASNQCPTYFNLMWTGGWNLRDDCLDSGQAKQKQISEKRCWVTFHPGCDWIIIGWMSPWVLSDSRTGHRILWAQSALLLYMMACHFLCSGPFISPWPHSLQRYDGAQPSVRCQH